LAREHSLEEVLVLKAAAAAAAEVAHEYWFGSHSRKRAGAKEPKVRMETPLGSRIRNS